MDSEAMKMNVRGNMCMDIRVIEVTEFKSEVKLDLGGHHHCRPLVFRAIALLLCLLSLECWERQQMEFSSPFSPK